MRHRIFNLLLTGLLILAISASNPATAQSVSTVQPAETSGGLVVDWDAIDILDLQTAARIAIAGNPSLAAAEARVAQAAQRVAQARSTYWPRLDLSIDGARIWLADDERLANEALAKLSNPNATVDDPYDLYRGNLQASWIVFNGFARKFSNAAARFGQEQSEAALADSQRLLLSALATAYFYAQLTRENYDIALADETFNERQLAEAQARYRVGTGSLSDELNFKIRINDAIAGRIQAKRNHEAALYALAALIGLPSAALPAHVELAALKSESPEDLAPPGIEEMITYAFDHRPDVQQLQATLNQSDADIRVARSRFYPSIDLRAGYDGDRDSDPIFTYNDLGTSVGLNLTYNLFAGGRDRARVREAEQRLTELTKTLDNLKITVSSEVRQSSVQLLAAQRQLELQRTNAELAQQNRSLVDKEYNAGQVSLVRLNEAQRDLVTAQGRLALTLATLRQAWYNLQTDTGYILVSLAGK